MKLPRAHQDAFVRAIASFRTCCWIGFYLFVLTAGGSLRAQEADVIGSPTAAVLENATLRLEIDPTAGRWALLDKRSGVHWPTHGTAALGQFSPPSTTTLVLLEKTADRVALAASEGELRIVFQFVDGGQSLQIQYDGVDEVRALEDLLAVNSAEAGHVLVPCREGLLISAQRGVAFQQSFGTSDYEGCHMNMLGLLKQGSALMVRWDDAYVTPELQGIPATTDDEPHRIVTRIHLRRSAHSVQLTPLGKGDWNTIATEYRRFAEQQGWAVTLREKTRRDPHMELLVGAANAKLWTCLERRMNEESTAEEAVNIHWTFDEAAQIAEHLRNDLKIPRCLFMIGGWTEGGYDCRHPDNLPANPECGGNDGLTSTVARIQQLGYVACLHDNYQDMYRDAKSWDPALIEKRADGTLIQGGRWLGGRAYMVCAPNQLKMAMRPQNLPAIAELFHPWSYFIDTTYAVGPRECADPEHPLDRNGDIAWKIRLSDAARTQFGLFGSECGREWALPHSDFFEGLVGVSGRYFHNLDPASLGAAVIPFWEMVYHDCQICYGKYGYQADEAAEYVAHHVLAARPLHYHSFPDHLYWQQPARTSQSDGGTNWTRADQGWAEGMHPLDVFLKNTHAVLGPLHAATAHERLREFRFLSDDRTLRQAIYGSGSGATTVWVNQSPQAAAVTTKFGGAVVLPPWGFVIEGPRFAAFLASSWAGKDYPQPVLFTVQSDDERRLEESDRLQIFHAFGEPEIRWRGGTYVVAREAVVTVSAGEK